MDEKIKAQVELWQEKCTDEELASELAELVAAGDEVAISDHFYRTLEFGTAGIRGTLGVGTNRMNVYVVAQATQGLADYLTAHFEAPSVAIARDSRNKGEDFQRVAAEVLAANGVHVYVYPRIEPVPVLSFTVRHLGCSAGIALTASHNPKEYSGYKAYDDSGCQIANEIADEIGASIANTDIFDGVKRMGFEEALEKGIVEWTSDDVIEAYLDAVQTQSIPGTSDNPDFKVVYTPLNGSGLECMEKILARIGITDVTVVPEQRNPDGNFPTCPYPNPEIREALELGLRLSDEVHPDLMLGTDPDADRMGTAIPHNGEYQLLTGNEAGVLLIDWLCRMKAEAGEDISRKVCVSTIVSSALPDALAQEYGFEMRRVLTGFKYVGEQIDLLKAAGEDDRFLLGFEESYGYLVGTHARDKDAIVASMLTCEMASWYAKQGLDLVDAIEAIYQRHGYQLNGIVNVGYPGESGTAKMAEIMVKLRENPPAVIGGLAVEGITDYKQGVEMQRVGGLQKEAPQTLPGSNVLEYRLEGGNKVIIRPSGTEPKVKGYLFSNGATREESEAMLAKLGDAAKELLS
ncbi:MAG: phospho-sugar mutase [Atopobiaceae bacterium]|nr:phospho-sugar mutase [Atopobiaceae bacterium]